jgi:hypothetical protein
MAHFLTDFPRCLSVIPNMKKIFCSVYKGKNSAVRRRYLRQLLWRQRKTNMRGGHQVYFSLRKRKGFTHYIRIRSPQILGLRESSTRRDSLRFFANIRDTVLKGGNGVIIDFSLLQTIRPTGGLMLVAELDRIKKLSSNPSLLRCKAAPDGSLADQVLTQIGAYQILGHSPKGAALDQSVVHWRSATGLKAEGEDAGTMLEKYDGELAPALRTSLYNGIIEAMTNAVHHAYIDIRRDGINRRGEKRWWLFSEQREGSLFIAFCDLGIGIPESLPIVHSGLKAILSKLGADRSDVEAIKLATRLGETSTSQDNRGKGLSEILDAARKSEQGSCVIYSNRGQFGFARDGATVENQFSNSIFGTLIEWQVPISEGVTNDK